MKLSTFILAASASSVYGYPGMKGLFTELLRRQAPPQLPLVLIGDLATKGATTPVGTDVLNCLSGNGANCESDSTYTPPGPLGSSACEKDTCCVWDAIAKELKDLFTDCDGTCNALARAAIRFAFHDAAAWNVNATFGGADGSLFLTDGEINRSENNGLQEWRSKGLEIIAKYKQYNVGAADFAQFAHNVAVVTCPLGPRTLTYIGREDGNKENLQNLLPSPFSSADVLLEQFNDKTINEVDLIALIGAHTTGNQFFVDTSKAGQPFDSTPGIWDVKFYSEVVAGAPPPGVFRLQSDDNLNANNVSHGGFLAFSDPTTGQALWNALYSKAFVRLSLLGVNKINQLNDCTKVLPAAQPIFSPKSGPCTTSSSSTSTQTKPTTTHTGKYTTSTIYSTKTHTTTSCAKTVKNCPAESTKLVTETVAVSTTVCPVEENGKAASKPTVTAKPVPEKEKEPACFTTTKTLTVYK